MKKLRKNSFICIDEFSFSVMTIVMIHSLSILFVSIVLEALPFVFLGTIIASVMHVFLTPQRMQQLMPKNPVLAYLFAGLMGLFVTICECVSVPLLKQLIKKGVPLGVGVTFMASAPIVNPLVMVSTWFAFSHSPEIFRWRIVGGFLGAIAVGRLFSVIYTAMQGNVITEQEQSHQGCHHHHDHTSSKLHHCIVHFLEEFTTICGYLIVGALLASLAKIFVPVSWIDAISRNILLEIFLLQMLAFALSLCSEADAFIARTFQGMFSDASILGFLLFGPMIDFKNTMMLRTIFSWKHIIVLLGVVTVVTGLTSLLFLYSTVGW